MKTLRNNFRHRTLNQLNFMQTKAEPEVYKNLIVSERQVLKGLFELYAFLYLN